MEEINTLHTCIGLCFLLSMFPKHFMGKPKTRGMFKEHDTPKSFDSQLQVIRLILLTSSTLGKCRQRTDKFRRSKVEITFVQFQILAKWVFLKAKYIRWFLCTRHCPECFLYILFQHHKNPMDYVLLLIPLYSWGNWCSARFDNWLKATELLRWQSQECLTPKCRLLTSMLYCLSIPRI